MTNKQVMKLMTELGLHDGGMLNWIKDNGWVKFANKVAEKEREACAKLLDDFSKTQMTPVKDTWRMGVVAAANAVRDKK
jgi:hypothetical protein